MARRYLIQVRVSVEELELLRAAAKLAGGQLTWWCRGELKAAAERELMRAAQEKED